MENLGQAVLIMVLGMGGVYVFLTVQALITVLLTRLAPADEALEPVAAFPPSLAFTPTPAVAATPAGAPTPAALPSQTLGAPSFRGPAVAIAIIQAAITAYESDLGVR